jgi:general secretion pathway protein G
MIKSRSHSGKGFTIIELIIVVAIIGILSAIVIWNLTSAMQRTKQKRTMADMRSLATAWEARATDYHRYNAAAAGVGTCNVAIGAGTLNAYLTPTYIRNIPTLDGWGRPFSFFADQAWSGPAAAEYAIISAGKDATFQTTAPTGITTDFDCDIIYSDGAFLQYPEGVQSSK